MTVDNRPLKVTVVVLDIREILRTVEVANEAVAAAVLRVVVRTEAEENTPVTAATNWDVLRKALAAKTAVDALALRAIFLIEDVANKAVAAAITLEAIRVAIAVHATCTAATACDAVFTELLANAILEVAIERAVDFSWLPPKTDVFALPLLSVERVDVAEPDSSVAATVKK